MYYALYDKDFNALGSRKTYPCSSWSYRRRANDFDELVLEGMAIDNAENAVFVGLHDEYMRLDDVGGTGTLKALALSGVPDTKDGKTKINAVDIRQLLSNSCVIDLTSIASVADLYGELLTCITDTGRNGYANLGISVSGSPILTELAGVAFKPNLVELSKGVGNPWELLQVANSIYDCFVDTVFDMETASVTFKVRRIVNETSIKLEDFGASKVRRDSTVVNRAVGYAKGVYTGRYEMYLQTDDTLATAAAVTPEKITYPMRVAVFEEDTLDAAKIKCEQTLYKNRFKASAEVSLDNKMGYLLRDVDLTYMIDIHGYKKLPVMETYEDSKGKRTLKMGRLEEYWWQ